MILEIEINNIPTCPSNASLQIESKQEVMSQQEVMSLFFP